MSQLGVCVFSSCESFGNHTTLRRADDWSTVFNISVAEFSVPRSAWGMTLGYYIKTIFLLLPIYCCACRIPFVGTF